VKLNRHWTKEQIKALTSKCKSCKEFTQKYKGAYLFALRRGWKDEVLKDLPVSFRHWDYETCQIEARKYNTKKEFRDNCGSAYAHASENNFLDEICGHMQVMGNEYKRMIYAYEFSDGHAYVGLTYNEKKRQYEHFYEKKGPVAKHISKSGIKPKYVKLHDYVSKEVAVGLEEKFIKDYRANGWKLLNGIKGGALGGNERKWTFEKCFKIAQDYKRKEDLRFAPGLGGLYNAARKNGWWDKICSHMTGGNTKWTKERVLQAAKSCTYVGGVQKNYAAAYRAAKKGNYLKIVQSHLKKKLNYWDEDSVAEEAKKYNTISLFQKGNPGAYNYAMRNKLLEKVTSHMSKLNYWNFEKCKTEAEKYNRRVDFMKLSGSCYQHAREKGYLGSICKHMSVRNTQVLKKKSR
jgi:predicted GIY-YIG superfamily endonuclease